MYLFTRRVRVRTGGIAEAMAWATGIAETAHQVTGLDVGLYAETYGPQVGNLAFTTMVPDLAALEAANDKLAVDPGYLEAAARGQQFAPDGASDRLLQLVHPAADALEPPESPPNYATMVTSSCVAGSFRRGIELGVEIAVRASAITGSPTLFLVDTTGVYGGVNWLSGYADAQAAEAAQAAIQMDESFVEFLDKEVKGVYAEDPLATQQLLYRRVI